MPPKKIEELLKKHPEIIKRGSNLYCNKCQFTFHRKKYSLVRHMKTERHRGIREEKYQFYKDLTMFMVACNISWYQLENPNFHGFIENCISGRYGNFSVPSESHIRKNFLSPIYNETYQQIRNEIGNNYIYVSVDETTNANGDQIANVIVGKLDNTPSRPYVIASKCLQQTNNETITNLIITSLSNFWCCDAKSDKFNKVLLLVTDAAPYMMKVGKNLDSVFKNMTHVTCAAHGLNRVAEKVRSLFPSVNTLISSVKKVFLKCPRRINVFKNMLPKIPLPPQPTIIRWGTWLQAANYYAKYFDDIRRVMNTFSASDGIAVKKAKAALNKSNIQGDLKFIAENLNIIQESIRKLQSPYLSLDFDVRIVKKVQSSLSKIYLDEKGKIIYNKFKNVFNKNSGYDTMEKINMLQKGEEVILQPKNRRSTVDHFMKFCYAPTTSTEIEKSFSHLKWIYQPRRRRLTPENVEQILVVYFNNSKWDIHEEENWDE